jgi:hypothetical protein
VDLSRFSFGVFGWLGRRGRASVQAFRLLEQVMLPRLFDLVRSAGCSSSPEQSSDRCIEGGQTGEAPIARSSQAFVEQNPRLDLAFVARLAAACRQNSRYVVAATKGACPGAEVMRK